MGPGWYGKIPAVGDFASRRLTPAFVAGLDTWLQEALRHSKECLGEEWLDAFLTSHVWRFCLFPGVHGDENWLGIVMPSIDRVGRYFPLTVAASGDVRLVVGLLDGSATAWLNEVERAARSTLDVNATIEDFEAALEAAPTPWGSVDTIVEGSARTSFDRLDLPGNGQTPTFPADESSLLAHFAARSMMQCARGQGLWWAAGPERQWIECFVAAGWPNPQAFVKMIAETPSKAHAGRLP
jgi:type VI secretion system protein ImpM